MKQKAFTLLEILLVIAAVGILAAIVIVAINPQRQLEQVRNATLQNSVNTLAKAIEQYVIDGENIPVPYPGTPDDRYVVVCDTGSDSSDEQLDSERACIDLRVLVPTYLASIPTDESAPEETGIAIALNPENQRISTIIIRIPEIAFNTNDLLIASLTPNT